MTRPLILPPDNGFDYDALPEDIRTEAKKTADEVKAQLLTTYLEIGAALARIKARLPHGQFGKWLSAEFGLTERSAQNYMAAAVLASKSETVSVLRPTTLYRLAAPATPESVRREVIGRLSAGESISDAAIREKIYEARCQQGRAEQKAALAKRAPRRTYAQADRARPTESNVWQQRQAESEAAGHHAARLLLDHLPPEQADNLRRLLDAILSPTDLYFALRQGLRDRGGEDLSGASALALLGLQPPLRNGG